MACVSVALWCFAAENACTLPAVDCRQFNVDSFMRSKDVKGVALQGSQCVVCNKSHTVVGCPAVGQ